jgi:hypothetical protein
MASMKSMFSKYKITCDAGVCTHTFSQYSFPEGITIPPRWGETNKTQEIVFDQLMLHVNVNVKFNLSNVQTQGNSVGKTSIFTQDDVNWMVEKFDKEIDKKITQSDPSTPINLITISDWIRDTTKSELFIPFVTKYMEMIEEKVKKTVDRYESDELELIKKLQDIRENKAKMMSIMSVPAESNRPIPATPSTGSSSANDIRTISVQQLMSGAKKQVHFESDITSSTI